MQDSISCVGKNAMVLAMRYAVSYGIVDRRLLFDRYLHRMSLEGMAVYLFLVIAADKEGKSYYRDSSIADILRLSPSSIASARAQLFAAGLIDYRAPNWWLKNLRAPSPGECQTTPSSRVAGQVRSRTAFGASSPLQHSEEQQRPSGDLRAVRGIVPEALKALIRSLEEKS